MILSDNPIEKSENDKLRRVPLATKIAELISNFSERESIVIGIEGAWGAGKTSFVNLIEEKLDGNSDVIFLKFNPWNFSGQNEVIDDFFTALVSVLRPLIDEDDKLKQLKKYASKLTRKSEFSFSPELSFLGGMASIKAGEIHKFGTEKTIDQERAGINKMLANLNKKIVIVIDDIDRLDKSETRLIFKLVKLTANFPNIIFLLAYDREKVIDRLDEENWSGDEYLKKIVQVSFLLPEPDRNGLWGILFADLDKTIEDIYGKNSFEGEEESRWGSIFHEGFGDFFKTIRDIKRYISSLRLNWSIIGKEEINIIDFMSIEAIRVFAPQFYSTVAANKPLFTGSTNYMFGLRDDDKAKESRYKEILDLAPVKIRHSVDGVIKKLFPRLESNMNYSGDWDETWRNEKRICAEERFDFYFQLGIPNGAISETEINSLLQTLDNENNFTQNLVNFSEPNRIRPLLSKINDKIKTLNIDQIKVLIISLWNLEKTIDDEKVGVFDLDDVSTKVMRLGYQSFKQVIPDTQRKDVLLELLNASKTLFYPLQLVSVLSEEVKESKQREESVRTSLVSEESSEALKTQALDKIKKASEDGILLSEKNLPYILYRWRDWGGKDEVESYISSVINDKALLVELLEKFVSNILSTAGNYKHLDTKSIGGLYNIEEIEKLVLAITEDDVNNFTDKQKEAINLFKNPKKDSVFN